MIEILMISLSKPIETVLIDGSLAVISNIQEIALIIKNLLKIQQIIQLNLYKNDFFLLSELKIPEELISLRYKAKNILI